MFAEENVALDCPCCGAAIYQPLSWFKKTYSTCPDCGGGLTSGQFAAQIETIEQTFEATVAERLKEEEPAGGCGGGCSCS